MSKSISQIRQEFDGADEERGEELCRLYSGEARTGVAESDYPGQAEKRGFKKRKSTSLGDDDL